MSWRTEMPPYEEVLQGELLESGSWLVAELDTSVSWPVQVQKVRHCERDFWLIPPSRESLPAVAIKRGDEALRPAQTAILRFLSSLSWAESAGVLVEEFSGGNLPRISRRQRAMLGVITNYLDLSYLPEPATDDAKMALALMREGRGLKHPAYSFLSLWRVLETAITKPKDRASWVADAVPRLSRHWAKEAVERLNNRGITDIATHLYNERRHAIAHGARNPRIDPDDAAISEQLREELPVVMGLAELAIEEHLGVQTSSTVYREHLYELRGFKERIGSDVLERILADPQAMIGETVDVPIIDVELHRREPYGPLAGMQPVFVGAEGRKLGMAYRAASGRVQIEFVLDFDEERLHFDWQAIKAGDDGSAAAALEMAEVRRFTLEYLANGKLEVFENGERKLLSRKDAFIPVNFTPDHDWFQAEIARWKEEAERRAAEGK